MSLIQEALKRQQEEHHPSSPAGPPEAQASGPSPTPLVATKSPGSSIKLAPAPPPPPPPTENQPSSPPVSGNGAKKPRTWISLLSAALLIVLIGAGVVWMLWFAFRHITADSSSAETNPSVPTLAVADRATQADGPLQETLPEGAAVGGRPIDPPGRTSSDAGPGASGDDFEPMPTMARASAAAGPRSARLAADGPGADWPDLTLEGLVGKGTNGAAIINGEIVSVGESIAGATLRSIERTGVYIEFNGTKHLFKVNRAH